LIRNQQREIAFLAQYTNRRRMEGLASRYRLVLPERPRGGPAGEITGGGTGGSIEFQDRRDYFPGDDPRHIDWRAFARSDRQCVKMFREEVSPLVDIIADTSHSMEVTTGKKTRLVDLTCFFFLLGHKLNALTTVYDMGGGLRRIETPDALYDIEARRQVSPLPDLEAAPFRNRGGIRILLSDFLFPFAPTDLVRLFPRADRLILIQILSAFEDMPSTEGPIRLIEAETADHLDLTLNEQTVRQYRERLGRLKDDLALCARRSRGAYACIREDDPPETMAARLLEAAIIGV